MYTQTNPPGGGTGPGAESGVYDCLVLLVPCILASPLVIYRERKCAENFNK